MVHLRQHEPTFHQIIDVSQLQELKIIEQVGTKVVLGAGVTFREMIESTLLREKAPFLVEACRLIGSPQIRNLGTIGGNIANASSCADSAPVLLCLEAVAHLCAESGKREIPLSQLLIGENSTGILPGELLTHFSFLPPPEGTRPVFLKLSRAAQAISRITVAAMIRINVDGMVDIARITIGAATPQPLRMTEAENFLVGSVPTIERVTQAAQLASKAIFHGQHRRWSSEYKELATASLVEQALRQIIFQQNLDCKVS